MMVYTEKPVMTIKTLGIQIPKVIKICGNCNKVQYVAKITIWFFINIDYAMF